MRLDEEKLEALRSWGEKLRQARSEESAAVGRAILMLVEEIDRLHIDLWHARIAAAGDESVVSDEVAEEQQVASTLHTRLNRVLRRKPESAPAEREEQSQPETDTAHAQAWIASLRRQK